MKCRDCGYCDDCNSTECDCRVGGSCSTCADDYDADELGLDPEEEYDA